MKGDPVMIRRILVPLDGSWLAEEAIPLASELARLSNVPILLLRVVDYMRLERYGVNALALEWTSVEPLLTEELAQARDYLDEIKNRLATDGFTADARVRQGRVAREIVAMSQQDDLIVMASHGRGGLSRWLLGSVAEDVLRHSNCPVLLVKNSASAKATVDTSAAAD